MARATSLMFAAGADLCTYVCTVDVSESIGQQWINLCNSTLIVDEGMRGVGRGSGIVGGSASWCLGVEHVYFITHEISMVDHPHERVAPVPDIPCRAWPLMVGSLDWIECCIAESLSKYASLVTRAQPSRQFLVTNTQICYRHVNIGELTGSQWRST